MLGAPVTPMDQSIALPLYCLPMPAHDLPQSIRDRYEVHEWKHATAILRNDFPDEWQDIIDVLNAFRLCQSYITTPGGRKSKVSGFIDDFLYQRGWVEKNFDTSVNVDEQQFQSPTHGVDC